MENDQVPTHSMEPIVCENIPDPPIPTSTFLLDAGLPDLHRDLNLFFQSLLTMACTPGPKKELYLEIARSYHNHQTFHLGLMEHFISEMKLSSGIDPAVRYAKGGTESRIHYAHRLAAEFFNYEHDYLPGITRLIYRTYCSARHEMTRLSQEP